MNVKELSPPTASNVQFTLKYQKFVPSVPGCYALATFQGDILYVGLTENLNRRFAEHRDNPDKTRPTSLGMAFWFYYLLCASNDIHRVERAWLNQSVSQDGVYPTLNKISSPVF